MAKGFTRFAHRLWRASIGFGYHDGSLVAASIAYYVALSFYPLMLVLFASLDRLIQVTERGKASRQYVLQVIADNTSPQLASAVDTALQKSTEQTPTGGAIGFVVLVISAVAIFAQLDYAFDRIWHLGVERKETWLQWLGRRVVARFKSLIMLLAVAAFLLATMVASGIWAAVQQFVADTEVEPVLSWAGRFVVNLTLNFLGLAILYKYVPKPRIKWREAFAAGLVTAPLWEGGRQLLSVYFLRFNYFTAYGIIGSFLAIMLWSYYAMLVVLFGAEYLRVIQHERETETPPRRDGLGSAA